MFKGFLHTAQFHSVICVNTNLYMNIKNLQEGLSASCLQSDCRLLGWRSSLMIVLNASAFTNNERMGEQLHICWLFWVSDRQLYFNQRRGTCTLPVFQDRCGAAAEAELVQAVVQLLSRLSAPCVTCVIANVCRMLTKVN